MTEWKSLQITAPPLVAIAEDAFLLASRIRGGESLDEESYAPDDEEARAAMREWRIMELVIGLGERIVATTGVRPDTVWTPENIRDLLDAEYAPE